MSKVVMVWYGGREYGHPEEEDGEEFSSLSAAKRAFAARTSWDHYYPNVEECPPEEGGPEGYIYFGTLQSWCPANGADRVLSFGPRGGIRAE